jgi:hypothetical protein
MTASFERRVLGSRALDLVRVLQARADCHLGGGAALSALHLRHRLSADIDLFCHRPEEVRLLAAALPVVAAEIGAEIELVRDAGTFVRAAVRGLERGLALDLVYDGTRDIEPPPEPIEGIVVDSLVDLRAAKITCLLSRSEPRDLVDLLFLDRAGFPPEQDMAHALRKDGGIDPGVLAWLLGQFPLRPLPEMLVPLAEADLARFRDELRERLRQLALPA